MDPFPSPDMAPGDLAASCPSEEVGPALELHEQILKAHGQLRHAERDLALLLAQMKAERYYLDLGYASIVDYAHARLDLDPRKTRALVRIGRALPEFPCMDEAMASGRLCWTKAREILSVATTETEAAWVEEAGRISCRALELKVAAHALGEKPTDDTEKESAPVRMVFTMDPVEADQVRAVLSALRAATGATSEEVSNGTLLAQLAGRILADLEGDEAPTGERFRIVLEHCPRCGHTSAPEAEVTTSHVGQALCDAELLEMRPGEERGHVSRVIPPATRRAVLHRDHHRCQVPGCTNRLWLDLHHIEPFREGGAHSEANLITLCSVHHHVLHDGNLGIEKGKGGLIFRFGDGRVVQEGGSVGHVGHPVPPHGGDGPVKAVGAPCREGGPVGPRPVAACGSRDPS